MKNQRRSIAFAVTILLGLAAGCGDQNGNNDANIGATDGGVDTGGMDAGNNGGMGGMDAGDDAGMGGMDAEIDMDDPGCVFDDDCEATERCDPGTDRCAPTCADDTECGADQDCVQIGGVDKICRPTIGCGLEPGPDAYCSGETGVPNSTCDLATGDCEQPTPDGSFIVGVSDVTVGDGCDVFDPGSDIQGIELQDATGSSLGWGDLVFDEVIRAGNAETNYSVVDGTAPALDGDGCVDEFSGNVLSLGCGGAIYARFLDGSGAPIEIEDGQTIVVYEYGGICSTGSIDDEYTLSTCSNAAEVLNGNPASCSNVLGSGAGLVSFNVAL